jgi:hypothetical protein
MSEPCPQDLARAEISALIPIRERLARRSQALAVRAIRPGATPPEALSRRVDRCERVVRLLDARIRLAAEVLALGRLGSIDADID